MKRSRLLVVGLVALMCGSGAALLYGPTRSVGAISFIASCAAVVAARRRWPGLFSSVESVEVDARGVRRYLGPRLTEAVRWGELVRVAVVSAPAGVFLLLHSVDGTGVAIGLSRAQEDGLLRRLAQLPDFDRAAAKRATNGVPGATILLWEGEPGEAAALSVDGTRRGGAPPPARGTTPRR